MRLSAIAWNISSTEKSLDMTPASETRWRFGLPDGRGTRHLHTAAARGERGAWLRVSSAWTRAVSIAEDSIATPPPATPVTVARVISWIEHGCPPEMALRFGLFEKAPRRLPRGTIQESAERSGRCAARRSGRGLWEPGLGAAEATE